MRISATQGLDLQAYVECPRRVRQRAGRDDVDTTLSDSADVVDGHATGSLRQRPTRNHLDAAGHFRRAHVVEENDVRTGLYRLARLLEALYLNLDAHRVGRTLSSRPDHVA